MKKSDGKKTKKLNNQQKEKILWASVVIISGIILSGWMYNFITSTSIRIPGQKEEVQLPQITDLKKQLQEVKSQFKKFDFKNATSSDTKIKNPQEKFKATSTNANNFNAE